MKINTYNLNQISDNQLKFSVIISNYDGKYIYVRHKERTSFELPGGTRECGESILECAKREFKEETGALKFDISPLFIYGVERQEYESFGQVFFANVYELNTHLEYEIEEVVLLKDIPDSLTYPDIYSVILPKALELIN